MNKKQQPGHHLVRASVGASARDLLPLLQHCPLVHDFESLLGQLTGLELVLLPLPERMKPAASNLARAGLTEAPLSHGNGVTLEATPAAARYIPAIPPVPIILGEAPIGFLAAIPPESVGFTHVPGQRQVFDSASERNFASLDTRLSILHQRQISGIKSLLAVFSKHLSLVLNQLVVANEFRESPLLKRIKRIVAESYTEEISLRSIASQLHVSPSHCCKTFRKLSGVTLTEYIGRVRADAARELLQDPDMRIAEAAYAAGFQSLTTFNRVFRKCFGFSPSHFRQNLAYGARRD